VRLFSGPLGFVLFSGSVPQETALENPEVIAARERRQRIAMALNKPSTDQLRRTFADFDLIFGFC